MSEDWPVPLLGNKDMSALNHTMLLLMHFDGDQACGRHCSHRDYLIILNNIVVQVISHILAVAGSVQRSRIEGDDKGMKEIARS